MNVPLARSLRLPASGTELELVWKPVFALPEPHLRVLDHRPAAQRLTIQYREGTDPGPREFVSALMPLLKREAAALLPPMLMQIAAETGISPPAKVRIGGATGRWASRSGNGTISCSVMLLFLPPALVRHVMVHEMCHVVHMDHGPGFHALLHSLDPLDRAHSAALNSASRDYLPKWLVAGLA